MTTNFATLTGSEKQIEWASDLRAKMIENAKEYMNILSVESNALATYGIGKEFRKAIAQFDVMRWEQLENCFCMITPKMYTEDDEVTPESFASALDTVLETKDCAKFYINNREYINI